MMLDELILYVLLYIHTHIDIGISVSKRGIRMEKKKVEVVCLMLSRRVRRGFCGNCFKRIDVST